jgi:Uma2 family endonuclease
MIGEKVSTSVDLPVSDECKRVLGYALEEADRLGHQHIGTEHLLLGLLREEKSFAAEILHERGLRLSAVREKLAQVHPAEESAEDEPALKTPGHLRHNRIRDFIAFRLRQFLETNPLGEVVVDTEFQLRPNVVRIPDIAFVTSEHIKEVNADLPISAPLTLAIEVVFPNDGAADLVEKIDEYLRAGALSVWVIYPNMLEAHIFRPDANPRILKDQELLSEEKLLPGFSLPLNTVFG